MKFLTIIFILLCLQGILCQPSRRSNVSLKTNQFNRPLRQLQLHRIYQILIKKAGFTKKPARTGRNYALEKAAEELQELQKWQHWDIMLV